MRRVKVLLPTYNGELYIREQIESIINQSYSEIEIFLRDDKSSDSTLNILNLEYEEKIEILESKENIGVIANFFELLEGCGTSDYYALSDQDDYWKTDKIKRAVDFLEKNDPNLPLLYCANVDVVDENLNFKGHLNKKNRGPSFNNALVQNIATGCTIVLNKKARDLILREKPDYSKVVMHDWWFYLTIAAYGKVIYDEESVLLYRQHSNNTFGSGYSSIQRWLPRIKRYIRRNEKGMGTRQIEEFYRMNKYDLPINEKNLIETFLLSRRSFFSRLKFSFKNNIYRQNFIENIVCHILLIFNKW